MSDPIVQALTLTSIVIGFAITIFLVALVHRIHTTHDTLDFGEVLAAEEKEDEKQDEEEDEQEEEGAAPRGEQPDRPSGRSSC